MLTISNWIPSFSAMCRASVTLPSDEKGPGMATPIMFSAPIASTPIKAVTEESIPPLSPTITFPKPHLRT